MEKNLEEDLLRVKQDIKDLNGGVVSYIERKYLLAAILLIIAIIVSIFVSVYFKNPGPVFFPLAFAALSLEYLSKKAREDFMQRFAKLNNYRFRQTAATAENLSPYLNMGHDQSIRNVVSGIYQGCPIKFFDFECKIGEEKSRRTIAFTVCEIEFKSNLPHIFLDAHHHFLAKDPALMFVPIDSKNERCIQLEGDFNKYFTLYAPKDYEIETLQIFAPDIMAELIDHSKIFSLEFFGNHLYIYSHEIIDRGKTIYLLYSLAYLLIVKLTPDLERIKL